MPSPLDSLRSPFVDDIPDAGRDLIFSQTVEGLLRAMGPLGAADKAPFRAVGLDLDRPLAPAYPVHQWLDVMRAAAGVAHPGVPLDDAMYLLGRGFVEGYGQTMIGRAMLVGMRLLGPRRTLERFARQLSTGSSFFKSQLLDVGPGDCALWINRVTWPGWYFGLIERGLEHAGAHDVKASLLAHEAPGRAACLRVTWRGRT